MHRKALALTVDWNVPALTKKVLELISEASNTTFLRSNAELELALHRALRSKKEAVAGMLINYPVRISTARVAPLAIRQCVYTAYPTRRYTPRAHDVFALRRVAAFAAGL